MKILSLLTLLILSASASAAPCKSKELDAEFQRLVSVEYMQADPESPVLVSISYPKSFKGKELSWAGFQEIEKDKAKFSVELVKRLDATGFSSSVLWHSESTSTYYLAATYGAWDKEKEKGCKYSVFAKISK